jgi:16S rRNA (guanine527-N7)-methyltransferase
MPPEAAAGTDRFDAAAFAETTGATSAQMADLERYRALLEEWNGRMNLVGPSAMAAFWRRHAFDSAQLLQIAPDAKVWADLGAGAGLPGVVLAILLKDAPGAHVHLIESLQKRCRFLEAVVGELGLPATVHPVRAETIKLTGIDVVTARALAPLAKLLGYAQPLLRGRARGLFLKGRDVEAELAEARRVWRFHVKQFPSVSDPSGRVLLIESLARV